MTSLQLKRVHAFLESEESSSSSSSTSDEDNISTDDELLEYLEKDKRKRHCIKGYFESVVPTYTDEEFIKHFRLSRKVYEMLCEKFESSDTFQSMKNHYHVTSSQKHVALFLWFAAHEACSYRDIADRFDMSISTVNLIIHRVMVFISNMSKEVITWPNQEDKALSARHFFEEKENRKFPGVIGAIDGTKIIIDPPRKCPDDYIDRKGNRSISLQAICNEDLKFLDIFVGYPGSVHDGRIFTNSPVYRNLSELCGTGYFILGDSAYPCLKMLLTPYKDNGHLTRGQRKFNTALSSCRVIIEHAFGLLKQRFRQLYYLKIKGIKNICHFIRACCVLHNLADRNDFILEEQDIGAEDIEFPIPSIENGKDLRDEICRQLQTLP